MAELRTDEEQVQALKQWWDENGKSLLLGVAVALAAVFGWKGWQQQQAVETENASILYQNMLDAVVGAIGPRQDEAQSATANHLAEQLKTDYTESSYAKYAAMIMARVAVDKDDLPLALQQLDWVLANQPTESMYALASMRKARIIAAQGDVEKALALLGAVPSNGHQASFEELKGDLYLQSGDAEKAKAAYMSAAQALDGKAQQPLLEMKLNDLATKDS